MNPPNYSPISKALRIQTVTTYQSNPGPASVPAPYPTKGLTFEAASGTHLAGSDAECYKDSTPYTPDQNTKLLEQGDVPGNMKFQLTKPPQGILDVEPSLLLQTSRLPILLISSTIPVMTPRKVILRPRFHPLTTTQRAHQLSKQVTTPARDYSIYEVPPARGYWSPADIQWHLAVLHNYQYLLLNTIQGQGRKVALIGCHPEHPQQLVILNRPVGTLWAGTAMVCVDGLDEMWYISDQRTDKGVFYSCTWVHHGTKKHVKVLVHKEHFYFIPSRWTRLRHEAKNWLRAAVPRPHPNKATSTTHLPNF
ncbi:hypothetical protein C8R43DRAFT_948488 [Mycena crocata]|nr:hypothetical protein C8R43DRAFT_948488 [Mycena crocata]